ncbi:hypothetical protein DLM85_23000 [Hymenobacter edaphi]|uniref:Uncharacterized protein n=2 Tax=Hymenobacter edaphi TaxID=2211146 RepID=A0A328B5B0_9BACT|nr:hypothetical protein DLM85_23000 [Hymenobacter edaphi]
MQAAQRTISARHDYFELAALEQEETSWYPRLLDSVRFYVYCQEVLTGAKVYGVRERIRQWNEADKQTSLAEVHAILRASEHVLPVQMHLPTYLSQEGTLKTAVIGVEGVDFTNQEHLLPLLVSLVELSETRADYFLLVPVVNRKAGRGLRCNKEVFRWLKALNEGEEAATPADWQLPQPKAATPANVQPLLGIEAQVMVEPEENERLIGTLQALWKLLEYRRRLADASSSERAWLSQVETVTRLRVETDLRWLQPRVNAENYTSLTQCVTRCLNHDSSVEEEQLVTLLESLLNTAPTQATEI